MIVERETHLGAGSYERNEGRDGYANGFKPRNYQTFHGNLELQVPLVRGSSMKFYPKCLDRGSRSERAIAPAAAQMYIQGVSTRRVETVFLSGIPALVYLVLWAILKARSTRDVVDV